MSSSGKSKDGRGKGKAGAGNEPAAERESATEPAGPVEVTAEAQTEAEAAEAPSTDLHDVLILAENREVRLPEGVVGAFIRHGMALQLWKPVGEALAETWGEVYLEPWVGSHEMFVKGAWQSERPVFQQAVIRFGSKRVPAPLGVPGEVAFFMAFYGCQFDSPIGPLRKKVMDVMRVRPLVISAPHTGVPPWREVPAGEERKAKKRRELGSGLAGTRVEEW